MKKSIIFVLVIITTMVLSIGLLTCSVGAEPEATPTPAQAEKAPVVEEAPQQPVQEAPQTVMNTKINFDGSAVTTYTMDVDPTLLEKMPNFAETIAKQVEESGYTVELLDKEEGKKILQLTKVIKKGEKLTFTPPGQPDTGDFDFVTIKDFFSTMYIATARFDMRGYPESQELMKFSFETPVKPKFSNSQVQEKAGKLCVWAITGGSANPINHVIIIPNVINIAVALLLLAILIFVIFMVIISNKKKENLEAVEFIEEEKYDDEQAEDPFTEMTQEEIDKDIEEIDIEETDKKDKE